MWPIGLPAQDWVSKTDLSRYLRCPYAFYLIDRRLIAFEDTVNEQQVALMQEGVAFQKKVEDAALRRAIKEPDLPRVFARESIRLYGLPFVFRNPDFGIYGKPDGIDTARGALFPVEIKSHKDVQRSDELELAFYWMLLGRHRTKKVSPRGYLVLRCNGEEEHVEVELRPHRFEHVRELLQDIRLARQKGVQPRICGCTVCSGVMRVEIDRVTREKKDLTRLWGIATARARRLENIGIRNYEELLQVDSASIVSKLRECSDYVSPTQVDSWKHHAQSYVTSSPVRFGNPLLLGNSFMAMDLEYIADSIIWLVGICIVKGGHPEYVVLWADSPTDERNNLIRLAELTAANPDLPLLTWSGTSADIPEMRKAVNRLNLGQELDSIESRHLDLFQHASKAIRFPIPELGVKEVANYFGIPKVSRIRSGFEAQFWYRLYRSCGDQKKRTALKASLIEYNREDLEALVEVAKRITGLGCAKRSSATSPDNLA